MHPLTKLIWPALGEENHKLIEREDKIIRDYLTQRSEWLNRELVWRHLLDTGQAVYSDKSGSHYSPLPENLASVALELSIGEKCEHKTTVSSSLNPGKIFCQICGKDITPEEPKLPEKLELSCRTSDMNTQLRWWILEQTDKINELINYLAEKEN